MTSPEAKQRLKAAAFNQPKVGDAAVTFVVVGEVEQADIMAKLAFLQNLPQSGNSVREQPTAPAYTGNTLYLIDKPGAAQSEIRVGYLSDVNYDPTGVYFERQLMNYVLGGAFNSRINLNPPANNISKQLWALRRRN